jgi:MFS family permease
MFALLRQRNFGCIWVGGLISLAGDWMLLTALPVYVYQLTGSTLATGAMLATRVVPRILLGSVAGVFVDRWDRRQTLIVANLLLALGLLALLLVTSGEQLWLVYLVAFVQSAMAQFVTPALGALLPHLVDERELLQANALNALSNDLSRLVGPALGGMVVASTGLAGVAMFDSASFAVAASLAAVMRIGRRSSAASITALPTSSLSTAWAAAAQQWLEGLCQVPRSRVLTVMFSFIAISAIGEGVMGALFAPFVSTVLGGDAQAFGWIVSSQAIGGILGGLLVGWRGTSLSPARLLGFGALGLCLFDLMTFNYHVVWPGIWPAIMFMAIVGVPIAGMVAGHTTLLQSATEDAYRGRILGAFGAVGALSTLIGALLGGLLGDRVGIVEMLNLQGLGYGTAGMIVLIALRGRTATKCHTSSPARQERRAGHLTSDANPS